MLTPPFAVLDLETTGIDVEKDRIVEIAFLYFGADGVDRPLISKINPGIPIPGAATAIHGISDEDVKAAASFSSFCRASDLGNLIKGCTLVGHNARQFDVPMLDFEFKRAFGRSPFDARWPTVVDTLDIFRKLVPHTLAGTVQFFLGRDHVGAHGAEADAAAVMECLPSILKMLKRGPFAEGTTPPETAEELATWALPADAARWVDRAGKLAKNDAGDVCINFGQHRGKPLVQCPPSYLHWILGANFDSVVKRVVSEAIASGRVQ